MLSQNTQQENFDEEKVFLTKLNNTIQCRKKVKVFTTNSYEQNLAYVDEHNRVFLNFPQMKQKCESYFDFLLTLKSFDYHEMGHVIYTRYGWVDGYIREALNILEDQRIEMLFSTKYPKTKHYFRNISITYLLDGGESINDKTYAFIYGRRYIIHSEPLMKIARDMFKARYGMVKTEKVEKIIDEYLITTNVARQKELAAELTKIIDVVNPLTNYGAKSKHQKTVSKDEERTTEDMKTSMQNEDRKVEQEEKEKKEAGFGNSDDSEDTPKTEEEIKEKVEEIASDIKNEIEDNVVDDIERQMKIMDKQDFTDESLNTSRLVFSPSANHLTQSTLLAQTIKKLKNDLGNKTVFNQKHGVLNLRKAMMNEDINKFNDFKRFHPGRLNKTRLLVTLFVDSSGSMGNNEYEIALGSTWAISKALENTNSMTKVYEFSSSFKVIKEFNQTVKDASFGRNYRDNTNIISPLQDANKSLAAMSKKYGISGKLAVIVTDGQFSDMKQVAEVVEEMKKQGTQVILFKVGNSGSYGEYYEKYYNAFNKVTNVRNFESLNDNMIEVIDNIQKKIIVEVKSNGNY